MSLRNCGADALDGDTQETSSRIDYRRRLAHIAEQNAYKYGRISVASFVSDGYEVAVLFSQERNGYRLVVNGANIVDTNFTITNRMNIDGKLERPSTEGDYSHIEFL